ncbi:MAG TPA: hypothetical protein VNE41_12690 [Chitinophagaceae bacterium]|nr:hypothetical protein [Chitinophagaceae bacterium]
MKKSLLPLASVFLFTVLCTDCHSGPDPSQVASRFLKAILQSNYGEAKKYATPESASMLTALASLTSALPTGEQDKIHHSTISIQQVQVQGNMARVTYLNSTETKPETLHLTKVDGQWKVAFTKDYIMPRLEGPGADSLSGNMILPDTLLPQVQQDTSR